MAALIQSVSITQKPLRLSRAIVNGVGSVFYAQIKPAFYLNNIIY